MNRVRAVLLIAGLAAIGFALIGSIAQLGGKVAGVGLFLLVVLVAHDAVWLPLVLVAGGVLNRVVPVRRRPVVRVAAIVAAAVAMAALPLALGYGRTADNPSALPLSYGRNLLLVLLAIAVATGLALLAGRWRDHRRERGQGRWREHRRERGQGRWREHRRERGQGRWRDRNETTRSSGRNRR